MHYLYNEKVCVHLHSFPIQYIEFSPMNYLYHVQVYVHLYSFHSNVLDLALVTICAMCRSVSICTAFTVLNSAHLPVLCAGLCTSVQFSQFWIKLDNLFNLQVCVHLYSFHSFELSSPTCTMYRSVYICTALTTLN